MEKQKRKVKNEAIRNCAYIFNNKTKIPTYQIRDKPVEFAGKTEKTGKVHKKCEEYL